MKKYLFVLFILCLGCFDNVYAKKIVIDGNSYDSLNDIYGNGFEYKSNGNVLFLDNYKGGVISFEGELRIDLKNNNIINGKNLKCGIDVQDLLITGNGSLYIINVDIGINSLNTVNIYDCLLYIKTSNIGINAINNDLLCYQSKLIIKDSYIGIYCNNLLDINLSFVNVINCNYGVLADNNLTMMLLESSVYLKSFEYCLMDIKELVSELSKIYLESSYFTINNQCIKENEVNKLLVSNDNLNYIEDNFIDYQYIKMADQNEIDELLISHEGLILEIDESILLNEDNNEINSDNEIDNDNSLVLKEELEDEYDVDNESNDSNFNNNLVVFPNPMTYDDLFLYIMLGLSSLLFLGIVIYFRRYE